MQQGTLTQAYACSNIRMQQGTLTQAYASALSQTSTTLTRIDPNISLSLTQVTLEMLNRGLSIEASLTAPYLALTLGAFSAWVSLVCAHIWSYDHASYPYMVM